jgi:hypothetical protein
MDVVAGWLAGQIVSGGGFILIGDLIVGVIGAFIGDWRAPRLGTNLGVGACRLSSTQRSPRSCCFSSSGSFRETVGGYWGSRFGRRW